MNKHPPADAKKARLPAAAARWSCGMIASLDLSVLVGDCCGGERSNQPKQTNVPCARRLHVDAVLRDSVLAAGASRPSTPSLPRSARTGPAPSITHHHGLSCGGCCKRARMAKQLIDRRLIDCLGRCGGAGVVAYAVADDTTARARTPTHLSRAPPINNRSWMMRVLVFDTIPTPGGSRIIAIPCHTTTQSINLPPPQPPFQSNPTQARPAARASIDKRVNTHTLMRFCRIGGRREQ